MNIVAYLYNNNGMASWCWEAAHALHEQGQPVLLICAPEVELPGIPAVEILRFAPEIYHTTTARKLWHELHRMCSYPSGFVYQLHQHLIALKISPSAYYLNQSDLQDVRISVPQYVVAWAYPSSLKGYISKIGRLSGFKFSRHTLRVCLDAIGWYRNDWRAYRTATRVLPVSKRLATELQRQHINTQLIYPGTKLGEKCKQRVAGPVRLLIAAADLEEPRKQIEWMTNALHRLPEWKFRVTLVGKASTSFQKHISRDGFPALFTGYVSRNRLQEVMSEQDVFLFGSSLDDWGYVQVEAMSCGLVVIAPNQSPFDEIVGDCNMLYSPHSSADFAIKMQMIIEREISDMQHSSWQRASALFSRHTFAQSLLQARDHNVEVSSTSISKDRSLCK